MSRSQRSVDLRVSERGPPSPTGALVNCRSNRSVLGITDGRDRPERSGPSGGTRPDRRLAWRADWLLSSTHFPATRDQ